MTWEVIDNFHERAKVFGGWLVKAYVDKEHASLTSDGFWTREQDQTLNMSMCFVPDVKHEWSLNRSGK